MFHRSVSLVLFGSLLILAACGGNKNATQFMTSKEHFAYAMKYFKKKNYTKAQEEFSLITYKYSGSDVADDAQYYVAECNYLQKDYISAASEYDRLVSTFPKSEWVEESMYKLVLCYYELSPGFALDQKYTYDAMTAVQNYLDLYPQNPRKNEVDEKFKEIKTKLAKKEFESARIYRKISEYEAAIVYYDQVISDYYDSPFVGKAKFWKGYCYYKIEEYQKASLILRKFLEDYPGEKELGEEAQDIVKKIDEIRLSKK